jgi:mortality factor 4-like protein 1
MALDLKPKFQEEEQVLSFRGPLLYEAKCVKDKQVKHFIHYSGWDRNWDEWVPESRVLKFVDTNLPKQRELQYAEGKKRGAAPGKKTSSLKQENVEVKTKMNKQKTPGNRYGGSTSETPQHPRRKGAWVDPTIVNEETFMNTVEVKVKIPEPWPVDDWDLTPKQKQPF